MPSSEAAFRRKRRQWRESDFAAGKKVLPECRRASAIKAVPVGPSPTSPHQSDAIKPATTQFQSF
jgi:hypothetical protein